MSLSQNLNLLAARVGRECKDLHAKIGDTGSLTTTEKNNLVASINELEARLNGIDLTSIIDDSAAAPDKTYSSQKIADEILSASKKVKDDLLNGAGEAFDTLKELGTLIETNASAIEALEALAAGHVRFDEPQTITDEEKGVARSNIGAASAADLESLTTRVGTAETGLQTLSDNVGDTATDYVATFESALAGESA